MTTDVVPFQPPKPTGSTLELAPEAWKLASRVAGTEFVPKSLRGKPEAVLACILAGYEAGLSPMTSLRSIHVVDGRPTMSAELMRALVQRAGHEIWLEESTSERAIACGSRAGSERVSKFTWTMDDARRAGLVGKDNWKKYPRAMLLARASTDLCRALFPDVLAGISHSIEELSDGETVDLLDLGPPEVAQDAEKASAPTVTATAKQAATAKRAPDPVESDEPPAPDRGEVPSLPGEDDDESDIVDAEIVEDEAEEDWSDGADEYPADDDPPTPQGDDGPRMTGPQMIAIKLGERGVKSRDDKLRAVAAIVGHEVASSKDLNAEETALVLRTLDELPDDAVLLGAGDSAPADEPEKAPERTSVTPPEEWDADRWRKFLKSRKVTVSVAIREAARLGSEQDPAVSIGTLDELAGSGICADLVGFVEEKAS